MKKNEKSSKPSERTTRKPKNKKPKKGAIKGRSKSIKHSARFQRTGNKRGTRKPRKSNSKGKVKRSPVAKNKGVISTNRNRKAINSAKSGFTKQTNKRGSNTITFALPRKASEKISLINDKQFGKEVRKYEQKNKPNKEGVLKVTGEIVPPEAGFKPPQMAIVYISGKVKGKKVSRAIPTPNTLGIDLDNIKSFVSEQIRKAVSDYEEFIALSNDEQDELINDDFLNDSSSSDFDPINISSISVKFIY